MADLGESWTTQQLVEFLSLLSSFPDEQAAIRGAVERAAVERAAEALEAEVGAVVSDGQVLASTGFPADDVPTALLIAAAEGKVTTIEVPGAGASATISVPLEDGMSGRLVLARGGGEVFSRQEANLLRGMGRVLALTLNFRGERAQRERSEKRALENAKLLATLQERQGELKLIGELERAALLCPDWERLTQDVVERVALHLQVDHCAVLAYEPENHQLRVVAAVGWPRSFVGHLTVPATNDTQGGRTFNSEEPVIVHDLATDKRFPGSETLREHGILSGLSAPIRGQGQPYGGLAVHTTYHRQFTREEASFLEIVAGVLGAAAKRSAAEERIRHQAVHDGLTGLPNRLLFDDRLSHALAASRRHDRRLAVLFVDLDNFKNINDSLGHSIGDAALRNIAERLAGCLRPEDTLARMGADEFAIVLPEIGDTQDAALAAERVQKALLRPLAIAGGHRPIITASIGIAVGSHEQSLTAEELTRNADLAMHSSKRAGKGLVSFFAPSMHEDAVLRLDLTSHLRGALDRGEFVVHYQPIVTLGHRAVLDTETVVGAEALVRWNHPRLGRIAPGVFIGLAEEAGLIGEIGRFVLGQACNQLQHWRQALDGCQGLFVAVNVSPLQLHSSDLLTDVESVLHHSGLPPDHLVLEITESVLCHRNHEVSLRLSDLKQLGVRLAVDDFGTGYSALSYLQDMPLDILKIDKSFIDGLGRSIDNDQLVDGIIELAHRLHLQTLAEGIETREQALTLAAMNSELGQGFHFSRPLPGDELEALLKAPARQPSGSSPRDQREALGGVGGVDALRGDPSPAAPQ